MTKVPSRISRGEASAKATAAEAAAPTAAAKSAKVASEALPPAAGDGLLDAIQQGEAEPAAPNGAAARTGKAAAPAENDGFESTRATAAGLAKLAQYGSQKQTTIKPRAAPGTALAALNEAQPPGVYFREEENAESSADSADPELEAAVEEAISLLFGVAGIHHIGPGVNDKGEPVVVIAAARGFSEPSLARIPATVRRFPTLLAIPFELLPLRRT